MKSEIERRRYRRAVNMLGRLVFTTLGPLTLSLLSPAYSPPAHAVTITVFGTPGTPGVNGALPTDGGPGGNATATTPANNDPDEEYDRLADQQEHASNRANKDDTYPRKGPREGHRP